VQLCKTNVFLLVMCTLCPISTTNNHLPPPKKIKKNYAGRSHFRPRICSWKTPPR
jgi:hypothetical protein